MELGGGQGRQCVQNGSGVFFVLSWANMDNDGECHQGEGQQQLHVRMTV